MRYANLFTSILDIIIIIYIIAAGPTVLGFIYSLLFPSPGEAKFVRRDVTALGWAIACCKQMPTPEECYRLPVRGDLCTCFTEESGSWPACMKKFCNEQEVLKVKNTVEKDVCDFMDVDGPFPAIVIINGKLHGLPGHNN